MSKYPMLPISKSIPSKEELIKTLSPYKIKVLSYKKRDGKLFAELLSRHRIDGVWWEDVVRQHFPGAFATCGCSRSYVEFGQQFKMRLL